jgi:hypothetical protein
MASDYYRDTPTVDAARRKLEELDEQLSEAFSRRDTRTFGRLAENRKWWSQQLDFALKREGYPRERQLSAAMTSVQE